MPEHINSEQFNNAKVFEAEAQLQNAILQMIIEESRHRQQLLRKSLETVTEVCQEYHNMERHLEVIRQIRFNIGVNHDIEPQLSGGQNSNKDSTGNYDDENNPHSGPSTKT